MCEWRRESSTSMSKVSAYLQAESGGERPLFNSSPLLCLSHITGHGKREGQQGHRGCASLGWWWKKAPLTSN